MNTNGQMIIDFCMSNNLLVVNRFYQYPGIHKFTRAVSRKQEIDKCAMKIGKAQKKRANTAKVKRRYEEQ